MLVVAHNGARVFGGAERGVARLLAGLQRRGHRVLLLCNDAEVARRVEELGVPARVLPLGGDAALHHAARMALVLRRLRPDALLVGTFRKAFLAVLAGRLAGVPRIVVRIGLETDLPRSLKYRLVLPRADIVVLKADDVRDRWRAALPALPAGRLVTIHGAVEPPRPRAPAGSVRAGLGIAPSAPVVGTVARLAEQKRIDRLLAALALLPDVRAIVAGDGELREPLARRARELGVAERTHFLGERDDVADVLASMDVFVTCSDREMLSFAMLEAMGAGIPVVSTPVSGAREALEAGPGAEPAGVVVPPEPAAIAAAVGELLADPGRRARMGEAGRRRTAETFAVEPMLDAWERVLAPPARRRKVVIHAEGRSARGNEAQLLLLAAELAGRGWEVVAACREGSPVAEAFRAAGARTAFVRPRGDLDLFHAARFAAWLRREAPDALLLASWKRFPAAAAAGRAARVPRIVLRMGGPQGPLRGAEGWKYRTALARGVDAVVVNSRGLAAGLRAQLPALAPRVRVVANAAPPAAAAPVPLRSEIGAGEGELVFVAAGGLEPRKGFDLLVGALARARRDDLRVAVAGEGPLDAALRRQAEALGVGGRVHLLGQRADLAGVLAAADAFVLPSRRDSMANVMLEAMAAGLPVIAADVPGAADALAPADGRPAAGWIVPVDDEAALAAVLAEVAEAIRRGTARPRAEEARWRAANWFTASRMADGYEAALAGAPEAAG